MDKEFFSCECLSDDHVFSLTYDEQDGELYMSVYLHQYRGFFSRLWAGIKYIFGYTSKYGHWDCTILDEAATARLRDVCDKSLRLRKVEDHN